MMAVILAISAVVSYLFGSANGAIIASKVFHKEDIRTKGSGNPGFTNYKRIYGNKPDTIFVMTFDAVKAVIPVLITALIMNYQFDMWQTGAQFSGLFVMLGHCFPLYYGFKGGKAVMSGVAIIWFVDWRMALIAAGIFIILLFTLRFMSVASCSASLSCPISLLFLGADNPWVIAMAFAAAALILIRHHSNFSKLIHGNESKFYLKSKKA